MAEEYSVIKNHFLKTFRHMKWSNLRILNLLEEENVRDGKVVELLSHIVHAEETWYKRITNEFYDNQFWDRLSIEDCKKLVVQTNLKFIKYIRSLPENDFQKKISYKNSRGIDYITSVEDILTHISLHGMYHRGQIMMIMRNAGKDVVITDYAMFIREDEYEGK
jgi:uncharacterized damage-inducible protein DinB